MESYYRIGKTVWATAPDLNRDLQVVTCDTLLGAGMTVRLLTATEGGRKSVTGLPDWRKYINRR